jgi:hypothetical protein
MLLLLLLLLLLMMMMMHTCAPVNLFACHSLVQIRTRTHLKVPCFL